MDGNQSQRITSNTMNRNPEIEQIRQAGRTMIVFLSNFFSLIILLFLFNFTIFTIFFILLFSIFLSLFLVFFITCSLTFITCLFFMLFSCTLHFTFRLFFFLL